MKGKKIFIYLLVLALLTTSISGSGLENVFASDKSTTSESTAEEQDNTSESSVPENDDETGAEPVSGEENYTDEETPDSETSTGEATEEEDGTGEEPEITSEELEITSENMNGNEIWKQLQSMSNLVTIDTDKKTINVKNGQTLTLLSNCPAEDYKEYTISIDSSVTGSTMAIPATAAFNGVDYQFQGLGTKEVPFSGTFNIGEIKIPSALFCGLSSAATFAKNNGKESLSVITDSDNWKNDSSVLAESYVFADTENDTFGITVSAEASVASDKKVKGSLISEICGEKGTLTPELSYSDTAVEIARTGSNETANAGLVCNTLVAGTIDASSVSFPASYHISTDNGSAGGVVGEMQIGTGLILENATIGATVTGTTAAGGIAGSSNGAAITVKGNSAVGSTDYPVTVDATENAGGLIGKAENTSVTVADGKNITVSTGSVAATGENGNAGGLFGYFSCQADFSFNNQIKLDGTATVKGKTAGGLVGVLVNNSDNSKISVGNTGTDNSDVYQVASSLEGQNLGGLIGQYSQTNADASLEISKVKTTSSITAKEDTTYGGLIGLVQNCEEASSYGYVKAEDADSTVAVTGNPDNVKNFGGMIGATGVDGYFLDFGNVTVIADAEMDAVNCGGLVGNLESGVLRLQGVTDLSSAKIKNEGTTKGQLVGYRNNALIYALGNGNNADWTLKRSEAVKVSDIGSYGEVYRQGTNLTLEGENDKNTLFTVDFTSHTVIVPAATTEISSAKDFAAIAICAQLTGKGAVRFAEGTFDFYDVGTALTLSNNIDLTGTGITGFMRDNGTSQANEAFTDGNGFRRNLNGNNHAITLSIGESYGTRGDSEVVASDEGSGQIYRHKNTGLFAVTAGATIQSVQTTGTITIDSAESGSSYCGALAAQNMGSSLTITDCSTDVTITYAGNYTNNSKYYVGGLVGEITADKADSGILTMTGNTIAGAIRLETPANTSVNDACMGGMISSISRSTEKNNDKRIISPEKFELHLSNTMVSGLKLTSNAAASMGGLLGYDWNNVAVTWKNVVVKDSNKDKTSLISNGNANFGGLVYQATGYWNVETDNNKNPGINIQAAAFTGNAATPDGLLVYSGRQSENSALYLEIKKDAYEIDKDKVTITENKCAKFDELVGVSMKEKDSSNGQGVVSLATSDASASDHRFNQNDTCTTYQNVTKNNNNTVWSSNENTRYYYNLDLIRKNGPADSGEIANEEELLTWSVRRYAATNIKGYFGTHDGNGNESVQLTKDKPYDLTGYSYYPVSVGSEENLTFDGNGATIKFDNEIIDTKEETKENTTTVMKTNTASQHRLMHFGLFLDYKASAPTEIRTYTLTVQNMKLTGNVGGILDRVSGALLCGTVAGAVTNTTINTHGLSVSGITLENLYVAGYQEKDSKLPYAPLLINQIDSYTAVSLNNIKGSYTKSDNMPQYAASSLIGNAGSKTAQNISLSFSSIALQDGAKSGKTVMFSRAMLLNSFCYKSGASGAATYNFNLADDWKGNEYTHNNATYGREISESTEYQDEEHWYYDTRKNSTNIYVNNKDFKMTGEAGSAPAFKNYKPYVYTSHNTDNGYHEIKVNVYVVDILDGCGTYGHPFQIASPDKMVAIAEYMRTGTAGSGWKIRLSKEFLNGTENTIHSDRDSDGHCSEYTYDGTNWKSSNSAGENESITNDAVHEYMRNAYYQITEDITLDSTFCGFGYDNNTAFRGVIVGKQKVYGNYPTITLQNSSLTAKNASHGLINNSYGSVVMNLNIELVKEDSKKVTLNESTPSEAKVNNYYGGVMGQILGGDNFIDNVTVAFDESVMNVTGTYKHLVPVGGYVGIIQGGCLIFRNMESADGSAYNGLSTGNIQVDGKVYDPDSEEYFYINHYVGRVLDGCAFYEKAGSDGKNILNNTDKNYQIATINPDSEQDDITTEITYNPSGENYPTSATKPLFMKTTVQNAQSLLILSAITNSGAAGGGIYSESSAYQSAPWYASFAYYSQAGSYFGNTNYGKARNASYQGVGTQSSEDFAISKRDDHNLVSYSNGSVANGSNTPYLVTKYTDNTRMTYFYSANLTRVSLEFGTGNFDMSQYGSGYRSIGGRYKSASVQTEPKKYNADRNTPFTRNFDGKNKTLQLRMHIKEYSDDNYHAIGVGGVFNVLQQNIQDTSAKKDIRNELANITISGEIELSYYTKEGVETDTEEKNPLSVGVGGLVGRSANRATDAASRGEGYYADIRNIQLQNLMVKAPYNAGGIVGLGGISSYAVDNLLHSGVNANFFAVHFTNCNLFENVTITSGKNAGGFMGWSASNASNGNSQTMNPDNIVDSCKAGNVTVKGSEKNDYAESAGIFFGKCDGSLTVDSSTIKGSSVKANYAGMAAGQIRYRDGRKFKATDTCISANENNTESEIQAQSHAGGLVGRSEVESGIERCTVSDTTITANTEGGLLGEVTESSDIYGCKVSSVDFKKTSDSTTSLAGALVGKLSAKLTGGNLLWDTNSYEEKIVTKGTWIGSCEKPSVTAVDTSSALIEKSSAELTGENLLGDTTSTTSQNDKKLTALSGTTTYKVQLAGVSRKDTEKSTSLDDVGSGEYDGYISYADYTVKNGSVELLDSSVNNKYPEAKFDDSNSLTLGTGEFIYLGEGNWTIQTGSESYVTIDDNNLLKANEVGIAKITKDNVAYTINVADSFVGTEIFLQNGEYTSNGSVKYNGKILEKWSVISGYFSSQGAWVSVGNKVSSVLQIPMEAGYTYKITYGEKDTNGQYPWGRMRLRVGTSVSETDKDKENGWMSAQDKDSKNSNAKKAYVIENGNEAIIPGRENQFIFLNYDNKNDYLENNNVPGYAFDTDGDKALFKSITVTRTGKISERPSYDSLQLISMPKTTFGNGETIDKSQMQFVLCESGTGIMREVAGSDVTLDIDRVTAETNEITATYNGFECKIKVNVMPYGTDDPVKVVYSPAGQYQNANPFSGDFGTLYGDAVYNTDANGTVTNNADLIYQEMTSGTVADGSGRVRYTATGIEASGNNAFDITHKLSNYKTEQPASAFASDFRVLLVSGSTTQKDIEQYLNLLTNGGYSKAVSNKSVTATSETYKWGGSTFKDTNTSSLVVSNSGTTNLSYAMGKTYDNGNDQFTLLTVTFTSGTHTQVVYVPIIVRRIVEINFEATLSEESIFDASVYDSLRDHVLVEYDSNMTGYLSWTYNASQDEKTEYDWQSYMDSGADLTRGFEKQIVFDCSSGRLPAGARITLIDTKNQDHVYSYTVQEEDKNSDRKVTIALTKFQDTSGISYKDTAVSKLYGATATKASEGKFVQVDSAESATAVVSTDNGDTYYRLKTKDDEGKATFKIKLNNAENVTEDYYIVVNVPKTSAESSNIASINGTVNSTVTTSAPCNITKVHRYDNASKDEGNNSTESTFSILSSYTQTLVDRSKDGILNMSDDNNNRTINISLLNTITFDTEQRYGEQDKLYQEFIATPYNNEQALSFLTDADTSGTVSFKVYSQDTAGNKKYYKTVSSSDKKLTKADNDAVCASYDWTSQEGKMTLILGTANNADSAIDLSKVRAEIMASPDKTKKICVEVTLSLKLADNSYNELVPASSLENGSDQPKNSLRLDYISKLARTANGFSASTWRGSCSGTSRYYKEDSGALNLKFEGDDIKQLGINLNDLKNGKSQVIDATASIDFNNWSGWKEAVDEAEKITFTFHLERKDNEKEYNKVSISDYLVSMKVGIRSQDDYNYTADSIVKNQDGNSWSFTQKKMDEKFANLNEGIFSLPVEYAVNISTGQNNFQYANYRLVVTVSMYDKDDKPVTMLNQSSLSDYVTYTVARVLKSF